MVVGLVTFARYDAEPLPDEIVVDSIKIIKSKHVMLLFRDGKEVKSYHVALGPIILGHKEREGDGKTPEGKYLIDYHKPDSAFHLALHITYPNVHDIEVAKNQGVNPGGAIMIHGIRNGLGWIGNLHRLMDWTSGCIAVTNREIEEIWRAAPDGTDVEISQ